MEDVLAGFISFGIVGWCMYCFFNGATGKVEYPALSDKFNIGYIERNENVDLRQLKQEVQLLKLKRELEKLKKDSDNKEKENSFDQKLVRECESALVTLGFKKKEAKQEVLNFLNKKKVDSVEEFVVEYFKKG